MTGARRTARNTTPHLHRRNGIFHLRVRVPDVVRLKLGMCEVHRSLKTYNLAKARLLAAVLVPRVQEVFQMAAMTKIDRLQLTSLLQSHFDQLATQADEGYLPRTDRPDLEVAEQRGLSLERVAELQDQIASSSYDGQVHHAAADLIGSDVARIVNLPAAFIADICQGAARAEIEQLRLLMHRLSDRLTPYNPSDPLFIRASVHPFLAHSGLPTAAPVGPALARVVEHHLQSGKPRWTQKTYEGKRTKLKYLVEHMGAETPITAVTPDIVRSYKVAISRLRSNHHSGKAQSFADKQTSNEKHRIASETVLNIYNPARAFFNWATEVEGYLSTNPAANVRIEAPKKIKGHKSRRPFTETELQKLFSAPLFSGCASPKRRFTPGKLKIRDDYFWIPVLGLYTGARLGEIVQLHIRDVVIDGPFPYLEISETADKATPGQPQKHVKSEAGIRKIPLHPDVLELGFGEFVARRRKFKRSARLFYPIKFGADGQASTVFSKWFARLLDKQDLKDPALTFHSLRHGVQDAMRDAKQPQYVIDRVFGHASGTTASDYGIGASLEVLAEAVRSMKLPLRLPLTLSSFQARRSSSRRMAQPSLP